jgi:GNAT superfamily N-acetyltransferase
MLLTELNIKTFTGHSIKPYLSCIARISAEVFREYPYLCDTNLESEIETLKKYAESEKSVAAILFEGSKVVGAATGIPLDEDNKTILQPFMLHGIDTSKYYHFGEALLLKSYRGRGVGHHFYEIREEHAKKLGYETACFYMKDRLEEDISKPNDYYPLDDFWRKRGYVHHKELKVWLKWKSFDEKAASEKDCSFWVKKLYDCTSKEFKNS